VTVGDALRACEDVERPHGTRAQIAELMCVLRLTWFTGGEPTFTPIMRPEIYGEAIANAKKIIPPPK
jgi:hypothetical protein